MRSKLFVPASRPEFFPKALAGDADAISIDLEDSVIESRKAEARAIVRTFLQSEEARTTRKILIVRVNPIGTPHFEADVAAVVQQGLTMINLPKPESKEDILRAVPFLQRAEVSNRVTAAVTILANIETPTALRNAVEIATAHPRVAGLQLGYGDLFEPLRIARYDPANVHATMFAMRVAAGEAGVFAYDGAYANVQDTEGYRAEAGMARRLGYWGKSCIHPSQVVLANDVFRPSEAEITQALRVLDGARQAEAKGEGAFLVDGKMIDVPFIRRAEAIVASARETNT
ncbi:MAG: CoA ester lyase [Usitatibacteraceae bacterium]